MLDLGSPVPPPVAHKIKMDISSLRSKFGTTVNQVVRAREPRQLPKDYDDTDIWRKITLGGGVSEAEFKSYYVQCRRCHRYMGRTLCEMHYFECARRGLPDDGFDIKEH
jgi:hypothetical protein